VKIRKAIRRVSEDGRSVLNAVVAANIGETGENGEAVATSVQHAAVVQRSGHIEARTRPTDKESYPND
jgi:hypothetical protein